LRAVIRAAGPGLSLVGLDHQKSASRQGFLVRRPGDTAELVVTDGVALTGGWLILGSHSGQPTGYVVIPTELQVVPLSDLK
jgi:hypothetical protein